MPSIQDELEALRSRKLTRTEADKLKDKAPMKTPEDVQAALKEAESNLKRVEDLSSPTYALGLENQWFLKQGEKMKEDKKRKEEAAKNLRDFRGSGTEVKTVSRIAPTVGMGTKKGESQECKDRKPSRSSVEASMPRASKVGAPTNSAALSIPASSPVQSPALSPASQGVLSLEEDISHTSIIKETPHNGVSPLNENESGGPETSVTNIGQESQTTNTTADAREKKTIATTTSKKVSTALTTATAPASVDVNATTTVDASSLEGNAETKYMAPDGLLQVDEPRADDPTGRTPTLDHRSASPDSRRTRKIGVVEASTTGAPPAAAAKSLIREQEVETPVAKIPAAVVNDTCDNEDVPELEEPRPDDVTAGTRSTFRAEWAEQEASPSKQQNRSEKKSRKMMLKLGMRPVHGISRVTIKTRKGGLFIIENPDVFSKADGDNGKKGPSATYVVFGEARSDDSSARTAASTAARQFHRGQAAGDSDITQEKKAAAAASVASSQSLPDNAEVIDDHEETVSSEEGVESKDIDLVMSQAGCSRLQAVNALKENDGDLVNAIMSLTI